MRRFVAYGPALIVLLTAAVVLFAVPSIIERINIAQTSSRIQLARLQIQEDDILDRINRAVRNVAVAVEPSVVHIDAERPDRQRGRFGVSSGAGWVYDTVGHVVTNAHVVGDARRIDVEFADGRKVSAVIIGTDDYTDIAVLRLSSTAGLFPMTRATHEQPRVGDRVFAFGSPFGFKFSMSEGIVSGLGRNPRGALGATGFANFIQTDAAVNPGNSGGPLVDVQGRLVGMNVAIATGKETGGTTDDAGQSAGISFAIPLATIESVVSQLIEGTVARGFLGINYTSNGVIEVAQGDTMRVGVPISIVVEDGPAWRAGMREFDVITHVNEQRINNTDILRSVIAPLRPGQHMRVRVWRSDDPEIKEQTTDRSRYVRQDVIGQQRTERPEALQGYFTTLNITLGEFPRAELANQLIMRYGFIAFSPEEAPNKTYIGALRPYRRIQQRTGAYSAGFRAGQEILSVQGKPIGSASEFYELLAAEGFLDSKAVLVTIQDNEKEKRTLTIEFSR